MLIAEKPCHHSSIVTDYHPTENSELGEPDQIYEFDRLPQHANDAELNDDENTLLGDEGDNVILTSDDDVALTLSSNSSATDPEFFTPSKFDLSDEADDSCYVDSRCQLDCDSYVEASLSLDSQVAENDVKEKTEKPTGE